MTAQSTLLPPSISSTDLHLHIPAVAYSDGKSLTRLCRVIIYEVCQQKINQMMKMRTWVAGWKHVQVYLGGTNLLPINQLHWKTQTVLNNSCRGHLLKYGFSFCAVFCYRCNNEMHQHANRNAKDKQKSEKDVQFSQRSEPMSDHWAAETH